MKRRRHLRATVLAVLATLFPGSAAHAQVDLPLSVDRVDTSTHPDVTLTVTAPRDLIGKELDGRSFRVLENGIARPVEVSRLPNDGLQVVLVIDTSGSMKGAPMDAAKAAAAEFLRSLPAEAQVAVVGFGDQPVVGARMGSDRASAVSAVAGLAAQGETALYDALMAAAAQFSVATDPEARRSVVVLSDGGDTASTRSLEQAGGALATVGARLDAVALATPESDLGALGKLATITGGKVAAAGDPSQIAGVYDGIASQLVNQYQVTYRSQAEGAVSLDVSLAGAGVSASWHGNVKLPALPKTAAPRTPVLSKPFTAPAPGLLQQRWLLAAGAIALVLALGIAGWMLSSTRPPIRRLAKELGVVRDQAPTVLTEVAGRATAMAERVLAGGGRSGRVNAALERAGLNMRPAEFVVMVATVVLAGTVLGLLVVGPAGGLLLGVVLALGAWGVLSRRQAKRQQRMADQLGDTLQLLASGLRSGHGLIQALDMVTREAESPTAEEFHRVIVETRLGRDLADSLDALAVRSGNEDVEWVVQAIRIHREVGGDLAEILDRVGETIRDRNRVRGQVRSLTAEGRLSAIILMALPFLVGGWMWLTNPSYISELFIRSSGRLLLFAGAVLMTLGGLVMKRLIRPEF